MKKILTALVLLVALYALLAAAMRLVEFSHKPTITKLQGVQSFCNLNEIKGGEKGVGLTVFRGLTPSEFYVTFVDKNYQYPGIPLKKYLIIARYESPYTLAFGMSGSPVYAYSETQKDWCLVGAVSLMENEKMLSSRESNIIGITPIKYMVNQRKIFGDENKIFIDNRAKAISNRFKPGEMMMMWGVGDCTVTYVAPSGLVYACGHSIGEILTHQIKIPVSRARVVAMVQGKLSSIDLVDSDASKNIMGTAVYQNSFGFEIVPFNLPLSKINISLRKGPVHLSVSDTIPSIGEQTPIFVVGLVEGIIRPYYDKQYLLKIKGQLKIRVSGKSFTSLSLASAYYDCPKSDEKNLIDSLALFFQRLEPVYGSGINMDVNINISKSSKVLKFKKIEAIKNNQISIIFQNLAGDDFTVNVPISGFSAFRGKLLNFTLEPNISAPDYLLVVSFNGNKILESEIFVGGYDIVSCGEEIVSKILIK